LHRRFAPRNDGTLVGIASEAAQSRTPLSLLSTTMGRAWLILQYNAL
jgi:hypothetical protein